MCSPLHCAAYRRQPIEVLELLLVNGASVNKGSGRHGIVPMHIIASRYNDVRAIDLLLDYGADINALSNNGSTPLHYAAYDNPLMVTFLIDNGASTNIKNSEGKLFIHIAASGGSIGSIKIAIDHGLSINARDNNRQTPLYDAIYNNKINTVIYLLANGADHRVRGIGMISPMDMAVSLNNSTIVDILRSMDSITYI